MPRRGTRRAQLPEKSEPGPRSFIDAVQVRTARVAVGASTVRGQRAPGLVKEARRFLAGLPLKQFGTSNRRRFQTRLDRATTDLMKALPKKGRSWGIARKVLNIFIRDALYNTYLSDAFRLDRARGLLELPLDSITVRRLHLDVGRERLPRWAGVKRLSPGDSAEFQAAAAGLAAGWGIDRVHLDAFWWGNRPE